MQHVYEVNVSSYAGCLSPSVLFAEESISHVHDIPEKKKC